MTHRILVSTILVVADFGLDASAAGDPTRFSVSVTGKGPDVVLIPGLATPAEMYEDTVTDARPRLPSIKTSTTVLYAFDATMGIPQGAVDSMYSSAYRGLAEVDLKRVDESYHFIMLDQPDVFLREVDAFLRSQ